MGTRGAAAVVVGFGMQATELSRDVGVQLLANSLPTVFGLGALIAALGPVSGAHRNSTTPPGRGLMRFAPSGMRSISGSAAW